MNLSAVLNSSIGKKLITGLTGFILFGFVIGHLIGNLLLLVGPDEFNSYAYFLEHLGHGWAVYAAEAFLLAVLVGHIWSTLSVQFNNARTTPYNMERDAGGASKKSLASMSMLITGSVLLVFIVLHVLHFKFGAFGDVPDVQAHVEVGGTTMRNLYGLVITAFGVPWIAFLYIAVMLLLGTHLSHGIWSAFQSLGLANDTYLPSIRKFGYAAAAILAVGFLLLPLVIMAGNAHYVGLNETQHFVSISEVH